MASGRSPCDTDPILVDFIFFRHFTQPANSALTVMNLCRKRDFRLMSYGVRFGESITDLNSDVSPGGGAFNQISVRFAFSTSPCAAVYSR